MGKMAIFAISPVSGVCPDLPKMVHFGPFGGSEPPDLAIWTPKMVHFGPLFGGSEPLAAGGSGGSRRLCPPGHMGPWWPLKAPTADDGSPGVPTMRMHRIMGLEMVQIWTIFGVRIPKSMR